jgi:hypothetical protein
MLSLASFVVFRKSYLPGVIPDGWEIEWENDVGE